MERQDPDLETVLAKHVSDKGLVQNMLKKKKKNTLNSRKRK